MSTVLRVKKTIHNWMGRSQLTSALFEIFGLVFSSKSHLRKTGWLRSARCRKPLSREGEPIPWMNYSVVDMLNERLRPEHFLFEYGSGFSTHYFAQRVKKVYSVEHDELWFQNVLESLPSNATLYHQSLDDIQAYVESVSQPKRSFDLIIVDGRFREECVEAAVEHLGPGGVIILDDTEREEYKQTLTQMTKRGFKALTLTGLKPCSFKTSQSTVFYRANNTLNL